MKLEFELCWDFQLDTLVAVSVKTFKEAFEAQNNPNDFKAYLHKAFSKETLRSEMAHPDTSFYFAYYQGKLAAYFKWNQGDAQTDIKRKDSMELERIYVLKHFQGKGFGKEILEMVKKEAKEAGKRFLWLGVWQRNQRAIAFYQRQGFQKFGTHPYFIGKDKQTDWLMRFDFDQS